MLSVYVYTIRLGHINTPQAHLSLFSHSLSVSLVLTLSLSFSANQLGGKGRREELGFEVGEVNKELGKLNSSNFYFIP